MDFNLERFVKAQESSYETALREIRNGRKRSHWIWYIFPQIQGLGYSEMSKVYGIQNLAEAQAYLNHPVLGKRLIEISEALLSLKGNRTANDVLGYPDDMKVKSSMTLFVLVPGAPNVFQSVLDRFYNGRMDDATIKRLEKEA